jgi:hypothetical protein
MYILVSVSTEAFDRVMTMRVVYQRMGIDTSAARDAPELLRSVRRSLGGRLVLIDWGAGEVIADKPLTGASGLATRGRTVVACSWIDQCAYLLSADGSTTTVTHPWLNYIHSVDVTPHDTLLMASAGSDLIVELTPVGEVVWDWIGPEHGYDTRPDGVSVFIDRRFDLRPLRKRTSDQAMHITAAIHAGPDTVLATLFHQGTLVAIDRGSGRARDVLAGLECPHGIHRCEGGFMVSDTLGHRVLILDENLKLDQEIRYGTEWLQDAIRLSNGSYLALENVHIDQLPRCSLTNRMTELDGDGRRIRGVDVGPDLRLFTVREIDASLAAQLARTWGRTGEFGSWHWT